MSNIKKKCANCKFADKEKGPANWNCTNVASFRDTKGQLPPYFPRVFSNDKCNNFTESEEFIAEQKAAKNKS